MTYTITKEFHFSAAHRLDGLPEDHQCARDHGHNYRVIVGLSADHLDSVGFVRDYGDLSEIKDWIDQTFDHRMLNDVIDFNPTAENLAGHIWQWAVQRWPEVSTITVCETDKTSATVSLGS